MKTLSASMIVNMKRYYECIFDKIGMELIPLDGAKILDDIDLKEEKELNVLVNQSFFDYMDLVLKIENMEHKFKNGEISESELIEKCKECSLYTINPLICDIENSNLKIHVNAGIDDHEYFGLVGALGLRLMNKDKCLLDLGPITDIEILKQGVPFSFNNYYCSGFVTEDGKEYLNNLNYGYRIIFQ